MNTRAIILTAIALVGGVAVIVALGSGGRESADPQREAAGRFMVVPIYVQADEPLAAYQFELSERSGRMRVVGVEGGEHPAFEQPPYFDRETVSEGRAERIIVAAFSLNEPEQLPTGRTRVASVHVHLHGQGEPEWEPVLVQAGNADGAAIEATVEVNAQIKERQ